MVERRWMFDLGQTRYGTTDSYGTTSWYPPGDNVSQAKDQTKFYTAHVVSKLRIYVFSVGGTNDWSVYFMDDGTSSGNVAVYPGASGWVEDVTGSDTPASGSLCNLLFQEALSTGSINVLYGLLTYDSDTAVFGGGRDGTTGSTMRYQFGGWDTTSAGFGGMVLAVARTFLNLRAYLTTAAASGATFSLNINDIASSNLTVSPTTTGAIEDVTGSDSPAADDSVGSKLVVTANTWNLYRFQVDSTDVDDGYLCSIYFAAVSQIIYHPFGGSAYLVPLDAFSAGVGSVSANRLQAALITGTSSDASIPLRINSTDSSNVVLSITASTTGLFIDITGSEAVGENDSITYTVPANIGGLSDGCRVSLPLVVIPTADLTGTVTASITETDIVTGGKTVVLTLTDATWIAA